jgi:alpha-L-rhamnosidase
MARLSRPPGAIGDPGDYLIEGEVADYAFGPVPLTPQFLKEFASILDNWEKDHPSGAVNFHTSYSLLWLQTLLDDFDATGDSELAKQLAPSAYRLLDRYAQWVGPNGLLSEAPDYLFMDWVKIGGFNAHHPPAVIGQGYLTAFYYRGLQDGLRLARLTGDTGRAVQYSKQLAGLREAFNRELWDADAGLYRDGKPFLNHNPTSDPNMLPPDRDVVTHSAQVNALAILYDLAPKERQAEILARVLEPPATAPESENAILGKAASPLDSLNVQPYFMHFVFAAEAHAGVFSRYAAGQLARWKINPETRTFEEMWGTGDWSHGWGGTPLIQMSAHVLGVSAASPGFQKVTLAPIPLGLTFAKGVVPTSHGDIDVSWTKEKSRLVYKVVLPASTVGSLDLAGVEGALGAPVSIDDHRPTIYRGPLAIATGSHSVVLTFTP